MLRCPERSRRSTIHCGDFARAFTPRITRPEKRPHRSGAEILTGSVSLSFTSTGLISSGFSGAPVIAAVSRATPNTDRQSALFGVSLISKIVSSSFSVSRISWPIGVSSGKIRRPLWSSESFSSRAEHSMPWLSTPRSFDSLIANCAPPSSAGGSCAPTSATGTLMPGATFGAPQTMFSVAPVPASTWQTLSLSASGCLTTSSTRPTTIFDVGGATGRRSSTSRPAIVSACDSCSVVSCGSTKVLSQDSGNCMVLYVLYGLSQRPASAGGLCFFKTSRALAPRRPRHGLRLHHDDAHQSVCAPVAVSRTQATSRELPQKAQIAFKEETQILHTIAQHRETH